MNGGGNGGSGAGSGSAGRAGEASEVAGTNSVSLAGSGGVASAGTSGVSGAGAGGADVVSSGGSDGWTGDLALTPASGSVWELPTGDPLNSTVPVLARLGDGIVMAGATTEPKLAGVDAFDAGVVSEAFVAGLTHAGKRSWSRPLLAAGLPNAIAVTATQEIVVVAPYLPDQPTVSPYSFGDSVYLGKFSAAGVPVFEKELPFGTGTRLYALAVDAQGAIWLAGAQTPPNSFPNESMVLAKYDAAGNQQFFHVFPHDGSTCYVTSLSVNAAGDVVLTGTFNGTFNLGGEPLTTQATYGTSTSLMPNGFAARFTNAGAHVWSQRFGGPIFDLGNAVTWLADGDIALGGKLSGAASVGGTSVAAEEKMGQAFVARLDGDGKARWVQLTNGAVRALAVDSSTLHVAGSFDAGAYLEERSVAQGGLLHSAKATSGMPDAYSIALDSAGSLWLGGAYASSADLGNQNQLSAASGVFLLRLDRAPK